MKNIEDEEDLYTKIQEATRIIQRLEHIRADIEDTKIKYKWDYIQNRPLHRQHLLQIRNECEDNIARLESIMSSLEDIYAKLSEGEEDVDD